MKEAIRGFTDAALEDAAEAGNLDALASDLRGVDRVVADSPDLRLVLADPGLATHVRRSVAKDLFAERIGEAAFGLISFVLDTDRAPDVVDDLAWLAERVDAADNDLVPVDDGPMGRLAATERACGYATAVLAPLHDGGGLGDVEDDLFRFSRVVLGSDGLLDALSDQLIPVDLRRSLVSDLLSSKAAPASTRLALYAVGICRPRDYLSLLDALVEATAQESQRRVAEVRSVVELSDEQQGRLGAALARILGYDVDVRVVVDPSVLGGFVASIGDSVVDGSVRHRLEQLRDRLVLPEANVRT